MDRAKEKKLRKRNALLKSAYGLFTSLGFHKTTISAIALKAGVAKGTFYLYFKDKEDIRDALIVQRSSQLLKSALDAMEASGKDFAAEDKLIFLIDYIVDQLSRDLALLRFISKNLSWGLFMNAGKYQSEDEDVMDFRKFVVRMLEADGIVPDQTMQLNLFTILELVNSTCYNVILNGEPCTIGEYKLYLNSIIRQIFRYRPV